METNNISNASWIPSTADLLRVILPFPQLAQRAGNYAFHIPEVMEHIASQIWSGGSVIADATTQQAANASTITNTSAFIQSTAPAVLSASARESWQPSPGVATSFIGGIMQAISKLQHVSGFSSYLFSRWAVATLAAAIVLNRTRFYASSQEHLRLRWPVRLAIYIMPMTAFIVQTISFLQALKCQTSPDFAQLRYGDPLHNLPIDFGGEGGFLYWLSSTLLFWQDDAACCAARSMSLTALNDDIIPLRGSMSLLFRFFITLCFSQLAETLSCSLQGKTPVSETGMTIFDHSLAFAECEAMMCSVLASAPFSPADTDGASDADLSVLIKVDALPRLNVPPEVLLVCLISCFSHLASASLAVTGIRDKVRLINTAVWSCCYMSAAVWGFTRVLSREANGWSDLGILRYPTLCLLGFIPHLLILLGIVVCGSIYGLALLLTALSVPEDLASGMTFKQRFSWAYRNLQANVQTSSASSIRLKMSEDFYTTLLKIGFNVLTAASEAVFLNEGNRIHVAPMTWLEQKRIDELAAGVEMRRRPEIPSELLTGGVANGVHFVDSQNAAISRSPYARERKYKPNTSRLGEASRPSNTDTGLGISQRRSRMQMTFDYVSGIFWLLIGVQALFLLRTLHRIGIERQPAWLMKAAGVVDPQRRRPQPGRASRDVTLSHLVAGPNGQLLMEDSDIDLEEEMRRILAAAERLDGEEELDRSLYEWWLGGGWWGKVDNSGEYVEKETEEDLTSVVSMSTSASTADDDNEEEWQEEESGRLTPTPRDPRGWREGTPVSESGLDMATLSRLLNPQTSGDREEARLLAHTLRSSRPMTRGQYRRELERSRAELVRGFLASTPTRSEDEEERDLEQFILSRRSETRNTGASGTTWSAGAEGMGAGGPQCVVCQSAPRTILVWPCGCLSMCDDCRLGLAVRNHTKCVCCRTDVMAISRLYVP